MLFLRTVLAAYVATAALADTFLVQQCVNGSVAGVRLAIDSSALCTTLVFGNVSMSLALDNTTGTASNLTLAAMGNSFSDEQCQDTPTPTEILCSCSDSSILAFVCSSAGLAIPSFLAFGASLLLYAL